MKKTLSLVLTMCMVLSLFATFAITASADEAVNLAAGKEVANQENLTGNTLWIDTDLTDGVVEPDEFTDAGIKWTSGQWFGYYNWPDAPAVNTVDGVAIPTVDLGATYNIESARVHVYAGPGWSGVVCPTAIALLVSDDGENWTSVASKDVTKADANCAKWIEIEAPAGTTAKYARVAMTLSTEGSWLFIDELEVYGTEKKAEVALEWKPFFLSHFDNVTVEGAGVVFTDDATNTNHAWRIHVVFAPIAGEENAYEIVDIIDYLQSDASKVTKTPVIPEGGFAYNLNYGNDYPSLGMGDTDFTSPNCNNMIADALTWKVGDKFVFEGLDLEGKTVPTSTPDTNWYDDAYVCTAKYAAYVPGTPSVPVIKEEITVDGEANDTGWSSICIRR